MPLSRLRHRPGSKAKLLQHELDKAFDSEEDTDDDEEVADPLAKQVAELTQSMTVMNQSMAAMTEVSAVFLAHAGGYHAATVGAELFANNVKL